MSKNSAPELNTYIFMPGGDCARATTAVVARHNATTTVAVASCLLIRMLHLLLPVVR